MRLSQLLAIPLFIEYTHQRNLFQRQQMASPVDQIRIGGTVYRSTVAIVSLDVVKIELDVVTSAYRTQGW